MFELNIILTLLILHTAIYKMLGLKNSGILSCGLFAFISTKENGAQKFNWDKFNHLGLDNDERGGDSVGRIIGDDIVKFVNNKKAKTTYQDYVINHKNPDPHHIAIGHTRKASVGLANEANAQPIIIDLANGKKFTMVHNGTLYNWEDLAKEYGFLSNGKTDSMVLAEIIAHTGFDVLTKYEGAAAIIIKDDREPDTILVFRGASKNYQNKVEEERPLYYYQESEDSMYISSKEDGLFFIGGYVDTVEEFKANTLYTIKEGQIIDTKEYDRTKCSSVKTWPVVKRKSDDSFYNTRRIGYGYGGDSYWSEYDSLEDYYERRSVKNIDESNRMNIKTDLIPVFTNERKIINARLRYWFRKNAHSEPYLANGIFKLDEEGFIHSNNSATAGKEYYFYCGVMIKDLAAYSHVKVKFGKSKDFKDTNSNIKELVKFSVYPIASIFDEKISFQNIQACITKIDPASKHPFKDVIYFDGDVNPLFSWKSYKCTHGDLTSTRYNQVMSSPSHKTFEPKNNSNFTPVVIDLTEGMCSKVTRTLAEKAVNGLEVKGFLANKTDSIYESKEEVDKAETKAYSTSIRDFTNEVEDDDLPKHEFSATEEEFFPTEEVSDAVNLPDDDDYEDIDDDDDDDNNSESSDYVNKAIRQGLDNILKSIDEVIQELEEMGCTSKDITTALSNFYKLQDPFLDAREFKKKPLIVSYEQF